MTTKPRKKSRLAKSDWLERCQRADDLELLKQLLSVPAIVRGNRRGRK